MSNYPSDWPAIRKAVRLRDEHRCSNCHASGEDVRLHTHHVVPLSQGGSHRLSNLVLLCEVCHDAAHGERLAPAVKWYTNGEMTDDEFETFHEFVGSLDLARFDGDEECWYIPKADAELLKDRFAS